MKNVNNLKYIQITKDMYWVDDFKSKHYNKLVDISKIFLHCTNGKTTAGCVSVHKNIMKKLIENINEYTKIKIFIQ